MSIKYCVYVVLIFVSYYKPNCVILYVSGSYALADQIIESRSVCFPILLYCEKARLLLHVTPI